MSIEWLLVTDVDDTLLGDDEALTRLSARLESVRAKVVVGLNSSRPIASLRRTLIEYPHLPQPDYLIGALGTEIAEAKSDRSLGEYGEQLRDGWDRDRIAAVLDHLGFEPHADEYQTTFKVSYNVPGEENYRRVLSELDSLALRFKVIYSSSINLDIIPPNAGKGRATDFLREWLGLPADRVVVAGDSANDREMFAPRFKGIVVANADVVLTALDGPTIYHTRSSRAAGVLEGLQHWRIIPDDHLSPEEKFTCRRKEENNISARS